MNTTQREFLKSIYNIPFKIAFDIFIFNESNNAAQGEGIDNAIRDERKKKKGKTSDIGCNVCGKKWPRSRARNAVFPIIVKTK